MSRAVPFSFGLLCVVAGCSDAVAPPAPMEVAAVQPGETPVVIYGTVYWNSLEGGFFAIRGRDGKNYDPTNLPAEYRRDMPVTATVVVTGGISVHMVGTVVKVLRIAPIGNPFAF